MSTTGFARPLMVGAASLFASVSALLGQPASNRPARPNVIVIYTDDQDRDQLGCYGGAVKTPHMDSLARDGMRFTRFYAASPVCTPSRYNVISGRYASRSSRQQQKCPPGGPINIGWEAGVVGERILPQVLQAGGYVTGLAGKWHIGIDEEPAEMPIDADPNDPAIKQTLRANYDKAVESIRRCGFDYVSSLYALNPGAGGKNPPPMFWLPKILQQHNMEWVAEGALEFIEQNHSRPFFLYVAPTLTHAPPATDSLRSDPRISTLGYLDTPPAAAPTRQEMLKQTGGLEPRQAAAVWLDAHVGAILRKLEELGIADNTAVLLASDNGRNGKFCCYDGGARTFMLARWKGVIPPGRVCEQLVSNVDLAPTILDMCGIKPPADYETDGQSIVPALKATGDYRRDSVFLEITTERAVVTDDGFKYIAVRYPPDIQKLIDAGKKYAHWCEPIEQSNTMGADKAFPGYFDQDQLYDLNADPNEQKNLTRDPKHRDRLDAMKKTLRDYSSRLPHQFGEFTTRR
ncbi:MAG: sulfatase-like hydrolase/transferase [Planctomycetes bacterium]|nr:sulfatase-like hydrolase/transferase [Planctomycetota bacterium]